MFANACTHTEDDLLLLDSSFDLTDKEGIVVAKMKILLSSVSGSVENIEEFMKKVESDVSFMSSLPSSLSTLVQVLKSMKEIMGLVSQVVHLSHLNLIIVNRLIEVIRYTRYSMHRGQLFPVFTK